MIGGLLGLMLLSIIIPLFAGIPVSVALGGAGLIWLVENNPANLSGAARAVWNTANSYLLTAIPLFILMGELIQRARIAERFYQSLGIWLGWLPGGLLHSNVGACAIFSAVSGSSVATAATVGTTAVPHLLRLGYDRGLTFGSIAAGGTLGILIPPSIPLIIYASLTNVSLGRLFLAAVIPGLAIFALFSLYLILDALIRGDRARPHSAETAIPRSLKLIVLSLADLLPVIGIIAIVLGGIYTGWATPTEVAALAVVAALLVAALFGALTWSVLWQAIIASVKFTSMILFVIIGAQLFAYALLVWGVPREVSAWIGGIGLNPYIVLAAIIVMYLFLGMFIDAISMMVLTISIVFPIIVQLGFDPVWFGVMLVLLLEIGLLTPPVGLNLYTILGIAPEGTRFGEIAMGALPFIFLLMVGVLILIAFPQLALWLPSQMF